MGTNYYFKQNPSTGEPWDESIDEDSPLRHIGKRSAAGSYCYKCGTTLCIGGTHAVHMQGSRDPITALFTGFHDVCPICGHEGVPCSSFTITLTKHKAKLYLLSRNKHKWIEDMKWAIDEYGREFTAVEMLKIIEECPIQFQNCQEFS